MANTSAPFGFRQYGQREGSAPTAGLETRFVSSGQTFPIFTGDTVYQSSNPGGYVQGAGSTTAITTLVYGVFLGCEFFNTAVNRVTWSSFWPGSGATGDVKAVICSNPEQLYLAQGSTGGVLGTSNIGQAVPTTIVNASLGNTITGQSVMGILSSMATGLSTAGQFMIVDVYQNVAPPGVNGTSTGAEGLQIAVLQPLNFVRRTLSGQAPAAIIGST